MKFSSQNRIDKKYHTTKLHLHKWTDVCNVRVSHKLCFYKDIQKVFKKI